MKQFLSLIIISLFFIQCKKSEKKENTAIITPTVSTIKYAKGFDIITENGIKKLIIKKVFQTSKKQFEVTLTNKTNIVNNEIKVPVNKLVVTSTTHKTLRGPRGGIILTNDEAWAKKINSNNNTKISKTKRFAYTGGRIFSIEKGFYIGWFN